MKPLTECRAEIDAIDRQIVTLFEQRMAVARDVAAFKMAHGLPVLDAAREDQVLEARRRMLAEPGFAGDVTELFRCLMAISRKEQARMLEIAKEDNHCV